MGCRIHKSSKIFLNKADLIELHEKHIKIFKWIEDNLELKAKMNNDYNKMPYITMVGEILQLLCNEHVKIFWNIDVH